MRIRKRSTFTKKAQADMLYYATVIAKVAIDDLDLEIDDRIIALKEQNIPLDEKISQGKDIALSIAYDKMNDEMIDGHHITDNSVQDVQLHTDSLDWDILFGEG